MSEESLVFRLRKRAEIRRQIPTRKSVLLGQPDRIAELLEEASSVIEELVTDSENKDRIILQLTKELNDTKEQLQTKLG